MSETTKTVPCQHTWTENRGYTNTEGKWVEVVRCRCCREVLSTAPSTTAGQVVREMRNRM